MRMEVSFRSDQYNSLFSWTKIDVLSSLHDTGGKRTSAVSDVEERDGKLYIGSLVNKWVSVYDLPES
jgi:hypothetical protein